MAKTSLLKAGELILYKFEGLTRSFPVHFHETMLVGMVIEGTRTLTIGTANFSMNRGDCLFLPPFWPHSCLCSRALPLAWAAIQIPVSTMSHLAQFLTMPLIGGPSEELAKTFSQLWKDPEGICPTALEKILLEKARSGKVYPNGSAGAIAGMWASLNLANKISLADLASCLGLDKYRLVRKFRGELGITPWRIIESMRINRASTLLKEERTIAQCALASGFYDQSHFSSLFRTLTGFTPGAWRRCIQGRSGAFQKMSAGGRKSCS